MAVTRIANLNKPPKKSKNDKLMSELKANLHAIHEANLSNIENREIFIDDKLDHCFDIISEIKYN